MIIHEEVILDDNQYDYVHSDEFYVLSRSDGELLWDDLQLTGEYTYEETENKIGEKNDYEKAVLILLGGDV